MAGCRSGARSGGPGTRAPGEAGGGTHAPGPCAAVTAAHHPRAGVLVGVSIPPPRPQALGPGRPPGCGAPSVSGSHCFRPVPGRGASLWPRRDCGAVAGRPLQEAVLARCLLHLGGKRLDFGSRRPPRPGPPPVFPKPSHESGGAGRAVVGGGFHSPSLPGTAGRDMAGPHAPGGRQGMPRARVSQGARQGPWQGPRGQAGSQMANGALGAESGRPWLSAPLPSGRRTATIPLVPTTGPSACVLQQGAQVTAPEWPSWDLSPGPEVPGFRGPPTAQVPSRSPVVTPPNYQSPLSLSPSSEQIPSTPHPGPAGTPSTPHKSEEPLKKTRFRIQTPAAG